MNQKPSSFHVMKYTDKRAIKTYRIKSHKDTHTQMQNTKPLVIHFT